MLEEWRSVPETSGAYEASSLGRIRSTGRIIEKRYSYGVVMARLTGQLLKPWSDSNGYLNVYICEAGARSPRGVHRIVAHAFHGAPPTDIADVNHKDGVKQNNVPSNIEWTTRKGNMEHALATGLLKVRAVECMPALGGPTRRFDSARVAAAEIGTSEKAIVAVAGGSRYRPTAAGYRWRYEGDEWKPLPPDFILRKPRSPRSSVAA
jgi:hypothetical protein